MPADAQLGIAVAKAAALACCHLHYHKRPVPTHCATVTALEFFAGPVSLASRSLWTGILASAMRFAQGTCGGFGRCRYFGGRCLVSELSCQAVAETSAKFLVCSFSFKCHRLRRALTRTQAIACLNGLFLLLSSIQYFQLLRCRAGRRT